VFGDRISRRRQSAELGHQLPAQARPFIAWLGSRCSGHGPTPVRAAVRLAFSITVCGLVPATNVSWLADVGRGALFRPFDRLLIESLAVALCSDSVGMCVQ
jgi:hypothetical protein